MTSNSPLTDVADGYPPQEPTALLALAEQYRHRNEREILELAAIPVELNADRLINLGLEPGSDPLLDRAFELQYPNVDPASLAGRSAEEIGGFVNGVKGKYFEVLVEDKLNAGESLGELQLESDQVAKLAQSPTQQGWDLEIFDRNGETVEHLQLKATESMSYVRTALSKNPNIRVAVPGEIDDSSDEILGTGISNAGLEETTEAQLTELSESQIEDTLQTAAEFGVDVIPLSSALVIVVVDGKRYISGQATLRETVRSGRNRLARATAYNTLGAALAATGLGLAAIPVVMGLWVAETRVSVQVRLGDNLAIRTGELNQLATRMIQDPESTDR